VVLMVRRAVGLRAVDPQRIDEILARIAARVRAARCERGLTQVELASRAGLTTGTISRLERGREPPTVSSLVRIAEAMGLELGALVGSLPPTAEKPASRLSREVRQLAEIAPTLDASAVRRLLALARLLRSRPRR
jgi:transcriptional regulator with XRE-family HTH domain